MSTKILVVAHKEFDTTVLPEGYQVIKVGNKLSDEFAKSKGFITDSTGDNISSENPYYCELTALYWAWKNLKDVDNLGIVHYRRYLMNYKACATNFRDNVLSITKIESILKKKAVILPYNSIKVRGGGMLYDNKPTDQQDQGWLIFKGIIETYYPDYCEAFHSVLYGKIAFYQNMFIMSKSNADEYCKWLFDVLKKYDNYISEHNIQRISRGDGYYSEYLLNVWITKNFKEYNIYRTEVANPEERQSRARFRILSILKSASGVIANFRLVRLKFQTFFLKR